MEKRLIIDLVNLPAEGKSLAGDLDPAFFDLPAGDAQPVGPVRLDLWVQRFGAELLLQGKVAAPFEFECVRTLQKFVQTLAPENFAISVEIGDEEQVDATEALREEILLAFPSYPRCDEADEPMSCEIDSRYLAVDKDPDDGVKRPPPRDEKDVWGVLDRLSSSDDEAGKP